MSTRRGGRKAYLADRGAYLRPLEEEVAPGNEVVTMVDHFESLFLRISGQGEGCRRARNDHADILGARF